MGIFDKDPKYQALKAIRDSGFKGPVNQDGKAVDHWDPRKAKPLDPQPGQKK